MPEYKPWQYSHSTHEAIRKGRPITAEEARPLLAEIERLEEVERAARSYLRAVSVKRENGATLERLLYPPVEVNSEGGLSSGAGS